MILPTHESAQQTLMPYVARSRLLSVVTNLDELLGFHDIAFSCEDQVGSRVVLNGVHGQIVEDRIGVERVGAVESARQGATQVGDALGERDVVARPLGENLIESVRI